MRIVRVLALEGPNVWYKPRALEVWLEQDVADQESLARCVRRIASVWTKPAANLRPSELPPLPWPDAPRDSVEIVLALMLNLQRRVDLPVREGFVVRETIASDDEGQTRRTAHLVVEIVEESVGRRCLELACGLFDEAFRAESLNLAARLTDFSSFAFNVCLGNTTGAIVTAAQVRGIPVLRLDDVSLVQLGFGARQHRIQTAMTDRSGCIAEAVSRDKVLTKNLLRRLGIPVPDGRLVRDADEAWKAAREIGLPVVVKPRDADYGNGVSLRLGTREEIAAAFEAAREYGEQVIVERFLEGVHHRVTVVGGRVIAAVRREPIVVVGDGQRTVSELIDEMNRDPRRGADDDFSRPWMWIAVDDELRRVLASQGSRLDDVPSPGQSVVLRFDPHVCWGGDVIDVTDEVHPDVAAVVIDAVLMIGLDVAGVDLVAADISRPLTEQNGGLLEVNAGPAIFLHLSPICQPPRPVPEAIISLMFPNPATSRIPLVVLWGDSVHGQTGLCLSKLLQGVGHVVGRSGPDGVFVDERCLLPQRSDTLEGTRAVLLHPRVEAAVCEVSFMSARFEGLAFDAAQVVIALNTQEQQPSASLIQSEEGGQMTNADRLAAVQVLLDGSTARGTAVVNVDDAELAVLAPRYGSRVIAISTEDTHPEVTRILERGGRAVFFRNAGVVLATGSHEFLLWPLGSSSMSGIEESAPSISLLAVVAAGWALDLAPEILRRELSQYAISRPTSVA